jgi:alpha-ribazole phosphatase
MLVYLIRHTSVDVEPGTCYGQTDVPLRPSFTEEAKITSAKLDSIIFDKVYTSPLSRSWKLAGFCGYKDALRDDRLMEINFGDWEMKRFDEIDDPNIEKWYSDYINVRSTNGESFQDQYNRVASFLDELKRQDYKSVAIFAHGGVLICAQIYAGLIKAKEAFESLTPYGGIVKIDI